MKFERMPSARLGVALTILLMLAAPVALAGGGPPSTAADPNASPADVVTKPTDPANPDWPCIQHKVETLTAVQMWDGPSVDDIKGWSDNEEIKKLVPGLTSRRVAIEDAATSIKAFAERQPPQARDATLTLLFAGLLDNINTERRDVIHGIERFQQRQRARALELERQGSEVAKLKEQAAKDPAKAESTKAQLAQAEDRYNWDARVFQERQRNLPLACEIPVLIEQRVFALAREIRGHMKD